MTTHTHTTTTTGLAAHRGRYIRLPDDWPVGATVEVRYTPTRTRMCKNEHPFEQGRDVDDPDYRSDDWCNVCGEAQGPVSVPVDTDEKTGRWVVDSASQSLVWRDDNGGVADIAVWVIEGDPDQEAAFDALVALVGAATAPPTPATTDYDRLRAERNALRAMVDACQDEVAECDSDLDGDRPIDHIAAIVGYPPDAVAALTSEETDR